MTPPKKGTTRFTMDVGPDLTAKMDRITNTRSVTKSEAIQRAVHLYVLVMDELMKEDRKLSITNRDDTVVKDILVH